MDERFEFDAPPNVQRADALRRVDLVARDGHEIDRVLGDVDGIVGAVTEEIQMRSTR